MSTFNEAGTYDVLVGVRDSQGQIASDNIEITVEEGEEAPIEEEPPMEETTEVETSCDASYPDVCMPPAPPNLTCTDVGASNFQVVPPDPHGFDVDNDGIGCESESDQQPGLEEELYTPGSNNLAGIDGIINEAIGGFANSGSR